MRFTAAVVSLLFAASLLCAGPRAAQAPAGNEPPQPAATQEQTEPAPNPTNPPSSNYQQWRVQGRRMNPNMARRNGMGMMGMMGHGPMCTCGRVEEHKESWGGPLRVFSQMEAELENPRVQTALGLTPQQVQSLRTLLVDTEIYTIQTGAGVVVDGIQLKELLRSDRPDRAAVMAKGNAISQSVSQIVDHYLDAILKAKTILTPQQQDMIRHFMAMHGHNMSGFGGMGMGMGMGMGSESHANPEH